MTTPLRERRRAFVDSLYRLHTGLSSSNQHQAAVSRQALARLRRSLTGSRHQVEAYEYVFAHDPPEREQDIWLLVAGLFALNPQPKPRTGPGRSIGASMGELNATRPTATRHFTQLLAREHDALPHHLRQTVRLLATHPISIDYAQLLDDLVVLLSTSTSDTAHRTRLRWARDFHRPHRPGTNDATTDTSAADPAGVDHDDTRISIDQRQGENQ
jgi:CRISPR system Cascade subunit CasB